MSLNLLVGYTGMMSFGHAAFFGMSTYTVIALGVHFGISGWLGLGVGILASTLLAILIGIFCIQVSGISFLMLTMAFSQLLYAAALKWRNVTGGSDGLTGFVAPDLFGVSRSKRVRAMRLCLWAFFWLSYYFLAWCARHSGRFSLAFAKTSRGCGRLAIPCSDSSCWRLRLQGHSRGRRRVVRVL